MKKGKIIMTIGAIALMGIGTIVGIAAKGTEIGEVNDTEIENVTKIETTNDEAIIMKEGESEAGEYEIRINILKEGMSTKGSQYTIKVK